MDQAQSSIRMVCKFCDAWVSTDKFRDHVAAHLGYYQYQCSKCPVQSASMEDLQRHAYILHGGTVPVTHFERNEACEQYLDNMWSEADQVLGVKDDGKQIAIPPPSLSRMVPSSRMVPKESPFHSQTKASELVRMPFVPQSVGPVNLSLTQATPVWPSSTSSAVSSSTRNQPLSPRRIPQQPSERTDAGTFLPVASPQAAVAYKSILPSGPAKMATKLHGTQHDKLSPEKVQVNTVVAPVPKIDSRSVPLPNIAVMMTGTTPSVIKPPAAAIGPKAPSSIYPQPKKNIVSKFVAQQASSHVPNTNLEKNEAPKNPVQEGNGRKQGTRSSPYNNPTFWSNPPVVSAQFSELFLVPDKEIKKNTFHKRSEHVSAVETNRPKNKKSSISNGLQTPPVSKSKETAIIAAEQLLALRLSPKSSEAKKNTTEAESSIPKTSKKGRKRKRRLEDEEQNVEGDVTVPIRSSVLNLIRVSLLPPFAKRASSMRHPVSHMHGHRKKTKTKFKKRKFVLYSKTNPTGRNLNGENGKEKKKPNITDSIEKTPLIELANPVPDGNKQTETSKNVLSENQFPPSPTKFLRQMSPTFCSTQSTAHSAVPSWLANKMEEKLKRFKEGASKKHKEVLLKKAISDKRAGKKNDSMLAKKDKASEKMKQKSAEMNTLSLEEEIQFIQKAIPSEERSVSNEKTKPSPSVEVTKTVRKPMESASGIIPNLARCEAKSDKEKGKRSDETESPTKKIRIISIPTPQISRLIHQKAAEKIPSAQTSSQKTSAEEEMRNKSNKRVELDTQSSESDKLQNAEERAIEEMQNELKKSHQSRKVRASSFHHVSINEDELNAAKEVESEKVMRSTSVDPKSFARLRALKPANPHKLAFSIENLEATSSNSSQISDDQAHATSEVSSVTTATTSTSSSLSGVSENPASTCTVPLNLSFERITSALSLIFSKKGINVKSVLESQKNAAFCASLKAPPRTFFHASVKRPCMDAFHRFKDNFLIPAVSILVEWIVMRWISCFRQYPYLCYLTREERAKCISIALSHSSRDLKSYIFSTCNYQVSPVLKQKFAVYLYNGGKSGIFMEVLKHQLTYKNDTVRVSHLLGILSTVASVRLTKSGLATKSSNVIISTVGSGTKDWEFLTEEDFQSTVTGNEDISYKPPKIVPNINKPEDYIPNQEDMNLEKDLAELSFSSGNNPILHEDQERNISASGSTIACSETCAKATTDVASETDSRPVGNDPCAKASEENDDFLVTITDVPLVIVNSIETCTKTKRKTLKIKEKAPPNIFIILNQKSNDTPQSNTTELVNEQKDSEERDAVLKNTTSEIANETSLDVSTQETCEVIPENLMLVDEGFGETCSDPADSENTPVAENEIVDATPTKEPTNQETKMVDDAQVNQKTITNAQTEEVSQDQTNPVGSDNVAEPPEEISSAFSKPINKPLLRIYNPLEEEAPSPAYSPFDPMIDDYYSDSDDFLPIIKDPDTILQSLTSWSLVKKTRKRMRNQKLLNYEHRQKLRNQTSTLIKEADKVIQTLIDDFTFKSSDISVENKNSTMEGAVSQPENCSDSQPGKIRVSQPKSPTVSPAIIHNPFPKLTSTDATTSTVTVNMTTMCEDGWMISFPDALKITTAVDLSRSIRTRKSNCFAYLERLRSPIRKRTENETPSSRANSEVPLINHEDSEIGNTFPEKKAVVFREPWSVPQRTAENLYDRSPSSLSQLEQLNSVEGQRKGRGRPRKRRRSEYIPVYESMELEEVSVNIIESAPTSSAESQPEPESVFPDIPSLESELQNCNQPLLTSPNVNELLKETFPFSNAEISLMRQNLEVKIDSDTFTMTNGVLSSSFGEESDDEPAVTFTPIEDTTPPDKSNPSPSPFSVSELTSPRLQKRRRPSLGEKLGKRYAACFQYEAEESADRFDEIIKARKDSRNVKSSKSNESVINFEEPFGCSRDGNQISCSSKDFDTSNLPTVEATYPSNELALKCKEKEVTYSLSRILGHSDLPGCENCSGRAGVFRSAATPYCSPKKILEKEIMKVSSTDNFGLHLPLNEKFIRRVLRKSDFIPPFRTFLGEKPRNEPPRFATVFQSSSGPMKYCWKTRNWTPITTPPPSIPRLHGFLWDHKFYLEEPLTGNGVLDLTVIIDEIGSAFAASALDRFLTLNPNHLPLPQCIPIETQKGCLLDKETEQSDFNLPLEFFLKHDYKTGRILKRVSNFENFLPQLSLPAAKFAASAFRSQLSAH